MRYSPANLRIYGPKAMRAERSKLQGDPASLTGRDGEGKALTFLNSHSREVRITAAALGTWFVTACTPFTRPQEVPTPIPEPTPAPISATLANGENSPEDGDVWRGIEVVKATKRADDFRYVAEHYLQEPFKWTLAQRTGELADRDLLALLGTIKPRESNSNIFVIVSDPDGTKRFTPNIDEARSFAYEARTKFALGITNAYNNEGALARSQILLSFTPRRSPQIAEYVDSNGRIKTDNLRDVAGMLFKLPDYLNWAISENQDERSNFMVANALGISSTGTVFDFTLDNFGRANLFVNERFRRPQEPPSRPADPLMSIGRRYDEFRARLDDPNLEMLYVSLVGSNVFETREDFLARNRIPVSNIGFRWSDGQRTYMAYGGGFLDSAIIFADSRAVTGRNDFCAPGSDDKRVIYQGLVDEFEQGGKVDKSLVRAVMAGAAPDCSYFIDVDTRTAPRNPEEVRIRG